MQCVSFTCKLTKQKPAAVTGERDAGHLLHVVFCSAAFLRSALRGKQALEEPGRHGWAGAGIWVVCVGVCSLVRSDLRAHPETLRTQGKSLPC